MKDIFVSQLRKSIKVKMSRNTQAEIADKLGITQAYLSMIINGKRKPKNIKDILKRINTHLQTNFSNN